MLETPYIWSMNLDMGEEDKYSANYGLTFYTSQGGDISSPDLIIRNVSMINANPVDSFIQESGLDIVWNYDQLSRKWTQNITTPYKISNLLSPVPAQIKKEIKSNFKIYDYETYGIRHYHSNFDFLTLYKKYRDLILGTNTITIDVRGLVVREVGQTVELKCDDPNMVLRSFEADSMGNELWQCPQKSIWILGSNSKMPPQFLHFIFMRISLLSVRSLRVFPNHILVLDYFYHSISLCPIQSFLICLPHTSRW